VTNPTLHCEIAARGCHDMLRAVHHSTSEEILRAGEGGIRVAASVCSERFPISRKWGGTPHIQKMVGEQVRTPFSSIG